MTKGGGKPKGRPRKIPVVSSAPLNPPNQEEGECLYSTGSAKFIEGESMGVPIELGISSPMVISVDSKSIEEAKEATAQKVEDGVVPPVRKRGMALGYVPPTLKQGIPTATLCKSEIEKEND